jgi:hypothetical protein
MLGCVRDWGVVGFIWWDPQKSNKKHVFLVLVRCGLCFKRIVPKKKKLNLTSPYLNPKHDATCVLDIPYFSCPTYFMFLNLTSPYLNPKHALKLIQHVYWIFLTFLVQLISCFFSAKI